MHSPSPGSPSLTGRLAAVFVVVFGFLPIVNWIPGGRSAPWYTLVSSEWLSGSLLAMGTGVVLAILTRRWSPDLARLTAWGAARAHAPLRTGTILAAGALALYALVARMVFSGAPLHLDELAQVIQARVFAQGRLYLDPGTYPEFRSALHMLDDNGRWYSQFPPGGPLLLVPGVWFGATWLVGPLLGASSVALFWAIARRATRPLLALGASTLFALMPFMAFMASSHMNHVGALFWSLLCAWALVRLDDSPGFAALAGFSLGMLGTIRPVDAVAFALPAGVWILWRVRTGTRHVWDVLLAGTAMAVPLIALLWYNTQTTGAPLRFGYEALWGPDHGLGFHAAPWGSAHTPSRGLELVSLYFLRLQTYLFETPVPGLVFVAVGLGFGDRINGIVRYWLVSGALVVLFYFMYWHDGFYLGPRFLYLIGPLFALAAAQAPHALSSLVPAQGMGRRVIWWTVVAAGVIAVGVNLPVRVAQYSRGLLATRQDPIAPARGARIRGALILVRESWGAQLVPRMWALGVPRALTEAAYRAIDTCELEGAITAWEREGVHGQVVVDGLLPLMTDSARLRPSEWSPDASERVLPGRAYEPTCVRRISEDRAGFTIFLPVLARDAEGNTYVRDLHARDSVLVQHDPSRPVYLLRSASAAPDAALLLEPLSRDSLWAEWRGNSSR